MAARGGPNFTFVHAADLHLDTPFHGVHRAAPHVARALREASLEAFDNIVELAIQREAAFLLVAGDIYDGAQRGLRAQLHFRDGLARLANCGIASFVVHGNHDPVATGWSAINDSWPQEVTVFGSEKVEDVSVREDNDQIATIQGISYATPATTENLARRFQRPDSPGFHIGLLHCNVAGSEGHADYSPCTIGDLRSTHLDYLALGHVHQRRILHQSESAADPWIVYPGNSQARSPRRSEQEAKGALVVEVEKGFVTSLEFVACDLVRFALVECSISTFGDLGELEDRLREIAIEELERAETRSVVLDVELSGRGAIHEDLARPGVMDDLLVRLRDCAPGVANFCWWNGLHDVSRPELDFDAIRGRGDFSSDLLVLSDQLKMSDLDRIAIAEELTASVPKSIAGRLHEIVGDDEQLKEIFERATVLAFDEISRDSQ